MFTKLKAVYTREILTHPARQFWVFLILFIVNVVAFGYFGLLGTNSAISKAKIIYEHNNVQDGLLENINKTDELEEFIVYNKSVALLSNAIPTKPLIAEYLRALTFTVARNGFSISSLSFSANRSDGNSIGISVQLSGNLNEVSSVLKSIEKMPRLTKIKSVAVTTDEAGVASIDLGIEIYKIL